MGNLVRSKNKVLAGVCAGIAERFGIDPTLVRVVWAIAVIFAGLGLWLYLILWLLMPAAQE